MKVEILREFMDKYTNEDYIVGDVIDIDEERYNEIMEYSESLIRKVEVNNDGDRVQTA
jgi:hypothetical protein|nr:MAG TPA: hypothetical protein [Caudoviricetes sp.]